MKKTVFEVHDLTVAYGKKPVLWGVDFSIPEGSLVAVVGPNGAGKSTLLKTAFGLLKPLSGWAKFFDKNYSDVRNKIAYVPQRESVDWDFPATVFDVVLMGRYGHLGWIKRPKKSDHKKAMEALEKVSMVEFKDRHISDLSGGQQQRVFLARALCQEADLYFLDEPFAGVDIVTEKAIFKLLKDLKNDGKTVVVVHHDIQTVEEYFDWLVLLNVRLVASGPLKSTLTKENLNAAYGGRLDILSKAQELFANK
ncbi:manganese ABC transporter ATP-binding protein [Candidatus Peregrinibacteria bacterium CG10_big_fil_rev_8_21_14_0_10_36_19]|nr:MAG: manganese ABC transporter ATP-binding protein [Candidatus Peregrinibacteria bacterium CG10_big_fil_rev_8_21_14_0_10_36_19]